ncbi:DEAD/DEAH box helicase [Halobaculum sp. MBLA0147]|uniref:DEAD/DEAH box helicase n=1 Tax=Halobaculum sp. MBLA0147 TaxID=3079934 RepID=UPI003526C195
MAEVDDEVASLVLSRASECGQCGASPVTDDFEVMNDPSADGGLKPIAVCGSCYAQAGRTISETDLLQRLEAVPRPYLTVKGVADYFDVSRPTAREALNECDELARDQPGNLNLYFPSDYRAQSEVATALSNHLELSSFDQEDVEGFASKPYYFAPPQSPDGDYRLIVPRFLDLAVGHLHHKGPAYREYRVDELIGLFDDLPQELRERIDLQPDYEDVRIDGDLLQFQSEADADRAQSSFEDEAEERVDETTIRVSDDSTFDVIAELIDGGNLPFSPEQIDPEDIRGASGGVDLRPYQQEAWDQWQEWGQVTLPWPMGAGKTFTGLVMGDRIIGEKLVVVPNRTLKQQWETDIEEMVTDPEEWTVETYQYLCRSDNISEFRGDDAPKVVIFDEAHHIAADKFSELALLDTDYRLGLTASPCREDGRESYIFALTGVPVSVDWLELVEEGWITMPDILVYRYRTQKQKFDDVVRLADRKPGKGIVFAETLEDGQRLADRLDVPFVSGETPDDERSELIENNPVAVVSRVADEGLSIPDLDWAIEAQCQGSSRRQETQRVGRLMHGTGTDAFDTDSGTHILCLTDDEAADFSDRLIEIRDNGFEIQYERRDSSASAGGAIAD